MSITKDKLFCTIITFSVILFRYLNFWGFIPQMHRYAILAFVIVAFIINLNKRRYSYSELLVIAGIIMFAILDFIVSGEVDIIIALVLAMTYSIPNGTKKLLYDFTLYSLLFFVLTLVFNYLGIIKGNDAIRIVDGARVERASLGFTNANHAFTYMIAIVIGGYILSESKKCERRVLFVIAISSYLIYCVTDSRTGFYSIVLLLVLAVFEKSVYKRTSEFGKPLFLLLTVLSVLIAVYFGRSIPLNHLLTNRPIQWLRNVSRGINLFGHPEARPDNNYLWLIYRHGLLIYVFYLYVYVKTYKKMIENKKVFISLVVFSVYSMFEHLTNYAFNILFTLQLLYLINEKSNYRMIECTGWKCVSNESRSRNL